MCSWPCSRGIQGATGIMNLGFFSIWPLQLEWVEGGPLAGKELRQLHRGNQKMATWVLVARGGGVTGWRVL